MTGIIQRLRGGLTICMDNQKKMGWGWKCLTPIGEVFLIKAQNTTSGLIESQNY